MVDSANAGAAAPYDTWETAITGILEATAYADSLIAGGEPLVTLHLATGTYTPRDQVMLTNAVHVIGHGADFDKVFKEAITENFGHKPKVVEQNLKAYEIGLKL